MKNPVRLTVATVSALALGGAFLLGTTVGGDSPDGTDGTHGGSHRSQAAGTALTAGDLSLVAAGSCDDLLDWYVENTRDLVTAWGWGGGGGFYAEDKRVLLGQSLDGADGLTNLAPAPATTSGRLTRAQASSATGTNVQETGVDEPDVVKTNGTILVRLDGDDLTTYDVTGKGPKRTSRLDLPGRTMQQPEFLLVGDRAVVLEQSQRQDGPETRVHTVDLSDPAHPDIVATSRYDAALLSARQYGDTVRLALGTGLPQLDFVTPEGRFSQREALKENRKVLEASTIADWLPTVKDRGEEARQVVDCADMSRPDDFLGMGTVSIVGFGADEPAKRSTTGVATTAQTVYSSTDRLYLALADGWGGWIGGCGAPNVDCMMPRTVRPAPDGGGTTQLHAFTLKGDTATYAASGEVEGTVADRWAMDEKDGVLRIAVGPSSQTGNANAIVTMKDDDGQLVELGRADRLGVNEQIMSVRWFDDLAVLVTFRRVDPLYAIDLADPAHPRKVGALKIPGYSDYLHPIGDDRILGIGVHGTQSGRTRGGQVAVFDLADLRHPKRLGVETYPADVRLYAGEDPRQFTWVPEKEIALAVFGRDGRAGGVGGFVSVLTVGEDGSLERRSVRGSDGYEDVARMRTLPLPDGRVAIITEKSVRFMTL